MTRLIKTFGRRSGKKLTDHQSRLIEHILPDLSPMNNSQITRHEPRTTGLSPHTATILEIGFGAGEHLLTLADMYPDSLVIGAEPYMNGIAGLLSRMMTLNAGARPQSPNLADYHITPQYKNIRIWPDDVRTLLSSFQSRIPNLENINFIFDKIYILHPDPWPKARHEKRRLMQSDFLTYLAGFLKPGGQIIFGTDHTDLFNWTLDRVAKTSLEIANPRKGSDDDYLTPPEGGLDTRYRAKNKFGSQRPMYLVLTRATDNPLGVEFIPQE